MTSPIFISTKAKLTAEQIALMFRVPYWLVIPVPRPRWRDRPLWRLRAIVWRWL